jgi:hypothetical protein
MPSLRISQFRDCDLRPLFPCKPVALLSAIALRFLPALIGARLIAAGIRSMVSGSFLPYPWRQHDVRQSQRAIRVQMPDETDSQGHSVQASTPFWRAAAAGRTTPVPRSTSYGVPFTMMAVPGPERSGSGKGVPVPRRTIWVLGIALLCACDVPCHTKRQKSASCIKRLVRHFVVAGVFPGWRIYAEVAAASSAGAGRS